uniref:Uncharacterized protein n=1 Tax=Setaria italica TaxID=4555 RepID=K4AHV9_SETIT
MISCIWTERYIVALHCSVHRINLIHRKPGSEMYIHFTLSWRKLSAREGIHISKLGAS